MNRFILSAGLRADLNDLKQNILNPRFSVIYKADEDQTFRLFLQAFENKYAQRYGEQFSFAVPAGYGAAVAEALFDSYFVGRDFDTLEEFYSGAQDGIANGELKG